MAAVQRKKHTKKWNPVPSLLAEVIACFELKIFPSAASATVGHLAESIKAVPQREGLGQTVSRPTTEHRLDPKIQLFYSRYQTIVLQEL